MKKLLAILLCLAMLFSLAACSKADKDSKSDEEPTPRSASRRTTTSSRPIRSRA